MPNLPAGLFCSPGDFLLDFCLGPTFSTINRVKVAQDGPMAVPEALAPGVGDPSAVNPLEQPPVPEVQPQADPSFLDQYGTPIAIGAGVAGAGALGGAALAYYQNQKKKKQQVAMGMAGATPHDPLAGGGAGMEAEKLAAVAYGDPNYDGPLPPMRTPRESIRDKVLGATGLKAETDPVARGFPVERLIADHELFDGSGPTVPADGEMYGRPAATLIDAIHARRKAWEDAHEQTFVTHQVTRNGAGARAEKLAMYVSQASAQPTVPPLGGGLYSTPTAPPVQPLPSTLPPSGPVPGSSSKTTLPGVLAGKGGKRDSFVGALSKKADAFFDPTMGDPDVAAAHTVSPNDAMRYGLMGAGIGITPFAATAGALGGGLYNAGSSYPGEAGRDGARGAMIGGATGAGLGIGGAVGGLTGGPLGALIGSGVGAAGGGLGMRVLLGKPKPSREVASKPEAAPEKKDDDKKEASFAAVVKAANPVLDWGRDNIVKPIANAANQGIDYVSNRAGQQFGNAAAGAGQQSFLEQNPWLPGLGVGAAAGAGLAALGGIGSKRKKKDRFGDIAVGGLLGAGVGGLAGGLWNHFGKGDAPAAPATPAKSPTPVEQATTGPNPVGRPPLAPGENPKNPFAAGSARSIQEAMTNSPETVQNLQRVTVPGFDTAQNTIKALDRAGRNEDANPLAQTYNRVGQSFENNDQEGARSGIGELLRSTADAQTRPVTPDIQQLVDQRTLAGNRRESGDAALGFGLGTLRNEEAATARNTLTGEQPKTQGALRAYEEAVAKNPNANMIGNEGRYLNTPFARTVGQGTLATLVGRQVLSPALSRMYYGEPTAAAAARLHKILTKDYKEPAEVAGSRLGTIARGTGTFLNQVNPARGLFKPPALPHTPADAAGMPRLVDRLLMAEHGMTRPPVAGSPPIPPLDRGAVTRALEGGKGGPGTMSQEALREAALSVSRGHGRGALPPGYAGPRALPASTGTRALSLTGKGLAEAYRSLPGGVALGLLRHSGRTSTGTSPAEDLMGAAGRVHNSGLLYGPGISRLVAVGDGAADLVRGMAPSPRSVERGPLSPPRPAGGVASPAPAPTGPQMTLEQYRAAMPANKAYDPQIVESMYQDYLRQRGGN